MSSRSPELEAIARRWMRGLAMLDGEIMVNLLSGSDPLVFCGSAEGEIWRGDLIRSSYAAHVAEIPKSTIADEEVEAYATDDTGWALWTGRMHFAGMTRPGFVRVTLIFALEKGIWKVQHIHNSLASPNIEELGIEHHVLDDLLQAARTSAPDLGRSGSATVMFTDIADSTALAAALGDARWADVVQAHVTLISGCLADHDGRLVKSLGDGTMSTFGSAGAAMQAAKSIQAALAADKSEPCLQVRIGLHTGDLIEAGDDFFGTVVNKAARIASSARAGEIRVSDASRAMVGGTRDYAFSDLAKFTLKGLEGEHQTYRLEWQP